MGPVDPRAELKRLHEASARISDNLLELELDSGRKLLEVTRLEGETAARWAAAGATLTELWRERGLLEALLARADELARERRPEGLAELLRGRTIELADEDVPLAERSLLGAARRVDRCSPDELLGRMARAFEEVKAVIVRIGAAWDALGPRVAAARRLLAEATRLAGELGESGGELAAAERTFAALSAAVTSDPLSSSAAELESLERTLQRLQDGLAQGVALKDGFDARLLRARELLGALRAAAAEAAAARERLVAKITGAAGAPGPDDGDALDARLRAIEESARQGAWLRASRALAEWTELAERSRAAAGRALEANRAPIAARDQFRSLLDAYQVKARRLGLIEDPELSDAYVRAHEELYTAPTDLALAAQLVRRYQHALGALPEVPS
jgi:hypothetical protein